MRFSKVIAVTLAAGPAGTLAAYEKALSSYKPNPPAPNFDALIWWVLNGNDWVALGTIALAAVSTGYSIYQMFQPDPATKKDVKEVVDEAAEDVNKRVDEVGGQVFLADQASEERDKLTHRLVSGELHERVEAAVDADAMTEDQLARIYAKVAEKLGMEGAKAATQNIVEAAARSSDEVQDLLSEGKFVEAGVAQQRLAEAGDAKQAQLWRDTARIKVLTSINDAIAAYARAVELDPSDFWTWIELSRLHRAAGSLPDARRTAEAALQHVEDEHDRMVAEGELGDVAVAEGKLPTATQHFMSAMQASRAIAAEAPNDLNLQRQLTISHNKLGDVAVAQGDLAGARTAYGAGLAIRERLAASDPGNAGWQRDLSISHNKLGDVARAQGDLAGARTAYGAAQVISERLAASDPDNAGWQYDLSLIRGRLGTLGFEAGNLEAARKEFEAILPIFERLTASDPGNATWRRDLFVSHYKLAQVAEASGDVAVAIREFEAGEAILVALLARVGDHPEFVRDLAIVSGEMARLRGG